MENIKPPAKKTKKVITKLSNSGRLITVNKKYLPTESSEDDVTRCRKRRSSTATVGSELARLKGIHLEMQLRKQKTHNERSSTDFVDKRSDNILKSDNIRSKM